GSPNFYSPLPAKAYTCGSPGTAFICSFRISAVETRSIQAPSIQRQDSSTSPGRRARPRVSENQSGGRRYRKTGLRRCGKSAERGGGRNAGELFGVVRPGLCLSRDRAEGRF